MHNSSTSTSSKPLSLNTVTTRMRLDIGAVPLPRPLHDYTVVCRFRLSMCPARKTDVNEFTATVYG